LEDGFRRTNGLLVEFPLLIVERFQDARCLVFQQHLGNEGEGLGVELQEVTARSQRRLPLVYGSLNYRPQGSEGKWLVQMLLRRQSRSVQAQNSVQSSTVAGLNLATHP